MDIREVQDRIYEFQQKRTSELGIDLTVDLVFIHFIEEVGEIARQIINGKYPSFRKYDEHNFKEEVVQAILDLILLSKLLNIDLPTEIDKKIREMEKRRLKDIPGDS